ncbi:uncharacterized protein LOC121683467 [Alosa sapidissima]|uniref:uncharacterized protein LOC121683467 n=1 Tax=Alosa sapidissima TaxID=34773 RepID=UPI001C099AD6|nr:uncharacterized protein LOC121683467 [Alosa sapidissima]
MSDVGDHKEEDSSGEVRFHTGNATQDQSWKRVLQGTGDSVSPTSSDVALNSEHSMGYPINFGTGDRRQQDRPHSPSFTVTSLKSDRSKGFPVNFSADDIQQARPHSPSFTVTSLKSDRSKGFPVNFSADDIQQARPHSPSFTVTSLKSDRSKGFPVNFSADDIQQDRPHSPPFTVTSLKSDRSKGFPVNFSADDTSQEKNEATGCFIKGVPDIQHQSEVTDKMASFQKFHKDCMSRKFKTLSEGPSPHTNPLLLNEIYTELYITEVESEEVNVKHEIRQIEKASRTAAIEDTPISCNDIFKPLPGQHKTIKTVLTVGVAGIGKTVSVHKFILDWAEGKTNEDIQFIFPLPFRELNLLKEKKLSLLDLIEHFFSEMKRLPPVFTSSKHRVMFIFDGLDECRIPLDFQSNPKCSDITEPVSVDVLLTNLIKGNLLSSALLWITTRPAAANQIPHASTNLVTEIRGFSDPQREEYLRKRISDEDLANRTISYLRSSRSLYIMCHIPVFCWITATVLERMLSGTENVEIPRTLTQVYVHFLTIQIGIKNVKYSEKQKGKDTDEEMIFKLGKLAFQQLEKVNLIFYEEDLRECGIDVTEALVYSGVCTQIFREESGLYQGKVFSFVHLSIQEFLAALYVFLSFSNKERTGKNKPDQHQMSQLSALFRASTLHDLHKTAVDLALQSKNGHLDLFLRFLLGLSLKSNQKLLQKLLKNRGASMDKEKTVEYLKSNFLESHSLETNLNLVHCLNELGDTSMVEDIQRSLISGQPPWPDDKPQSFHQCASLVYLLLTAAEGQYEFKYNQIIKTDTCLVKMLPVIKASIKARLGKCLLTANSCKLLAPVLTQCSCLVRDLDFSDNEIGDAGVMKLSEALSNPKSKLESLWLGKCLLTANSCKLLAPVLTQCSCLVRDLDFSDNEIGDAGVMKLSEALSNPKSKLESLWLRNCSLTENSCACLASVLSCSSSLRQLDLSGNRIQDAGVELLTDGLRSTHCTLEELRLHNCGLTDESCASLASALRSNPSHLRELHLSGNTLRESGEKLLEALQKNPHNSLESLISEVTDKMASFQKFHKDCMSRKFKTLSEGPSPHTTPIPLNEIYTELYITEVESEEVNKQHEIRQIEKASRTAAIEDTPISCNDIFKPLPGQHKTIKTVLTVGVAGIGKTVSVHKFILDWAEGKTNEDVQFIFPLPFRELNLLKEKKLSLLDLIEHFFSEMKSLPPVFTSSKYRVMFIFDGLDECRIPLDFQSNPKCSDVTEPVSVDVLLTNLIKGNLLSSALLWITTRPAAANQIPPVSTNLVTEIRGFSDPQREEYVMKKISDEDLAKRTITYLRSSRSLYIMCHIPVFCWITATVLERMLSGTENVEIPRTLTQVYVHFLIFQIGIKNVKYSEKQKGKDTDEEMIFKLGKLAFQQLEKVNLIFYEEDLRECGIDVTEALVYSGVCTQIFREESGLYQGKVFSFVHLSIQEFLAALYVFLCFSNREKTEKNIPDQQQTSQLSALFRTATIYDLHKAAVDLALQSKNGHLDLFLRFLLGLSLESNQKLLQKLLKNRVVSMEKEKTVEYLKSNILEENTVEKNFNLFHCLNELGDTSMVEEIQRCLISGKRPWPGKQPQAFHECATLLYLLLTTAEGQYEFNHNEIIETDGCVEKLLPVIKVSRKARLERSCLTAKSCELLASVLTQCSCLVRDLDFSDNEISDAGVEMLSMALTNPKCKLESLWLRNCSLTERSCAILASVLSCSSSLRQLDLSGNWIQDDGVELLTDGLRSTHCVLEELRLHNCGLTDESCASLASALRSNPSHLRELHLSGNTLRESGEKLLEALQKNPHNSLESLILVFYTDRRFQWIPDELRWRACPRYSACRPPSLLQSDQLQQGFFTICVNFKQRTRITDKRSFPHKEPKGNYF